VTDDGHQDERSEGEDHDAVLDSGGTTIGSFHHTPRET
jgi:hypothetical protein